MKANGFSLIEVLAALAVLSIALGAAVQAMGQSALNAAHLRDKTIAHWVAMNQSAELRIRKVWPSPGIQQGEEEMAGQHWRWQTKTSNTQATSVRRLDITVHNSNQSGDPLVRLESYLPKP